MTTLLAAALLAMTPLQAPDPQRDARMAWWREARFGLFIHWGLYAIPAGEWKGQTGHGEWIMTTAPIPHAEYEKFVGQFNPVKFDADKWMAMAKDAGMKYIVITTKHHDGFALFDSKVGDYDVMATPFKRDIMREIAVAARRHGLRLGWYHSIMDWHHPDYLPRRDWDRRPTTGVDFARFRQYLHAQVREILTQYGQVDVLWFDGEWESTWLEPYGQELHDLVRSISPKTIVNNRVSNARKGSMEDHGDPDALGDFSTPEQYIPPTGLPGIDWESCMTMNDHWGWNRADRDWKSPQTLVRNLVDIASKGGNYLLNVGPTAEGEFPPEAVDRLAAIGRWMKTNGEAIYGSSASPFESLPWGRATAKGGRIYLHVFDWPATGRLEVPGLGDDPRSARLLGGGAVRFNRVEGDLVLSLPAAAPDPICTVVALEFDRAPRVYRTPKIDAPAPIFVGKMQVAVLGNDNGVEVRYTLDGTDPDADSPLVRGPIEIAQTGELKVAAFRGGRRVSAVASAAFEEAEPIAAVGAEGLQPGLRVETFAGDWDRMPDFDALKPEAVGEATALDPPREGQGYRERVGRRFQGYILVPESGVYQVALTSDDGAKLWLAGRLFVDHDGLHSASAKSAYVALAKGAHPVRVEWFNKTGGAALQVAWAVAGRPLMPVDAGAWRH